MYSLLIWYSLAISIVSSHLVNFTSKYVCIGERLSLRCSTRGGGSTVWNGSFITCMNEIVLLHSRFENFTSVTCQDDFAAQSISVQDDYYTSELSITISTSIAALPPLTVTCSHDNGSHVEKVHEYKIYVTHSDSTTYPCEGFYEGTSIATNVIRHNNIIGKLVGSITAVVAFVVMIIAVVLVVVRLVLRKRNLQPRNNFTTYMGNNERSAYSRTTELYKQEPRNNFTTYMGSNERNTMSYSRTTESQLMDSHMEEYSHLQFERSLSIINDVYIRDRAKHSYYVMAVAEGTCKSKDLYRKAESLDLDSFLVKLHKNMDAKSWYNFGLEIGVPQDFLDKLKSFPDTECLIEVADHWLRNHPDKPSWSEIEDKVMKFAPTTKDTGTYDLAVELLVKQGEESPLPSLPRTDHEVSVTPPPIPPKP